MRQGDSEMTQGTYEIKNRLDGKAYGGRSGNIEQRWQNHLSTLRNDRHHCQYFQNAWNKYGEDVFEFIVLEVIEGPDERRAAEQKWLDIHHANKTCYNIAITAGLGGPLSEEHKHNISIANMGNQSAKGSKRTDEQLRAHSERMMGNQNTLGHKATDATRQKQRDAHTGKTLSKETKQKLREAGMGNQNTLGYKHPEEFGQAISERMMGNQHAKGSTYKRTDEQNRANSERMKLWWAKKKAAEAEDKGL